MTPKDRSAHRASTRPPFLPASEELRAICSALIEEASQWPGVTTRSMFGGILLYREKLPFGFLPRTRKLMEQDGLWLKFQSMSAAQRKKLMAEPRIVAAVANHTKEEIRDGPQWMGLLVTGPADVNSAVQWLGEAHTAAGKAARKK
jgi:hypothetical protein